MRIFNHNRTVSIMAVLACLAFALGGCATKGQTGSLAGAGIGALAGQAIGGNTTATLIGTGVGMGVGYIIGNEQDKKAAAAKNKATAPQNYQHNEVKPLGGTRWQVQSVNPKDAWGTWISKVVDFKPDGRMAVTTTNQDGSVDVTNEHYRVVGETLIVNKPGYLVNGRYALQGSNLVVDIEKASIVLKRLN